MITYEGARRCYRANASRAASLLERAKDEPENYQKLYDRALRANDLADQWLLEVERLKPAVEEK